MKASELPLPGLKPFAALTVQVDRPLDAGLAPSGVRRLIPILGGQVQGDGWTARVLPGGADFQLIAAGSGTAELDARYMLETDAGDLIFVKNRAVRSGPPELMERLRRGEPVDASQIYFRCTPAFETASRSMAWINDRLFIGTGARAPSEVLIRLFEVT